MDEPESGGDVVMTAQNGKIVFVGDIGPDAALALDNIARVDLEMSLATQPGN